MIAAKKRAWSKGGSRPRGKGQRPTVKTLDFEYTVSSLDGECLASVKIRPCLIAGTDHVCSVDVLEVASVVHTDPESLMRFHCDGESKKFLRSYLQDLINCNAQLLEDIEQRHRELLSV